MDPKFGLNRVRLAFRVKNWSNWVKLTSNRVQIRIQPCNVLHKSKCTRFEPDYDHNKAEDLELHFEQLLFYCYFNQFMGTVKKKNLKTKQMKQTFLAPIEAPCWLRPAKTASGVLGCIASIILTNKLFSQKIRDKNSVKPM